jgi:uncharacterized protein YceH (UPF0502 family)
MHLLYGPIDVEARAIEASAATATASSGRVSLPELAQRVSDLEAEVAELKEQLKISR